MGGNRWEGEGGSHLPPLSCKMEETRNCIALIDKLQVRDPATRISVYYWTPDKLGVCFELTGPSVSHKTSHIPVEHPEFSYTTA